MSFIILEVMYMIWHHVKPNWGWEPFSTFATAPKNGSYQNRYSFPSSGLKSKQQQKTNFYESTSFE
ncbi:hypothetical protein BLOT_009235 [Blomia tropicalis]|nr:hypothetical protein BLOT_009235 [Blomia tropicalis]